MALIAVAALGALVALDRTGTSSPAAPTTFKLVHAKEAQGPWALVGRVRVPPDMQIGGFSGAKLRATTNEGEPIAVQITRVGVGEAQFRIPAGYRSTGGSATLELVVGDRTVATDRIERLPLRYEDFPVAPVDFVHVGRRRNRLIVRIPFRKQAGDVVKFVPIRTENQSFFGLGYDMAPVGDGILEGSVETPYAAEASKLKFEIRVTRFQPDEFVLDGLVLKRDAAGQPLLVLPRDQEVRTRNGRTILFKAQRSQASQTGEHSLLGQVPRGRRPEFFGQTVLLDRTPESLGLRDLDVQLVWPTRSDAVAGSAGFGRARREGEPLAVPREGPLGPLRFQIQVKDRPRTSVQPFAVPIP